MSSNDQKPPVPTKEPEFFPPPPPGPPPIQTSQPGAPKHANETPIPEYEIPPYDPRHPQFAPPPKDELYDATPTDESPPPFPHRPTSSGKHDGEGEKKSWSHKLAGWGTKAAAPFNALANKMGSETFLPTTLDKECEKAARILRSFAKDGIYSDAAPPVQSTSPTDPDKPAETTKPKKPRVLLTIPSKVISRAQGLAIFTTARAGFQVSGATGSGILIARLPDGSWSPPSGIQVHSVGAGFVIGLDIYDCVVVINTREALEAFTRTRMSLGSDLAVTAGPWGAGGALDFGMPQSQGGQKGKEREKGKEKEKEHLAPPEEQQEPQATTGPETTTIPAVSTVDAGADIKRKPSPFREVIKNPVYSYVKSRGFYAGVQIDGTVVTERKDANAAFYGGPVSVQKIIKGEVPAQGPAGMWPAGAKTLFEVLKGAEGWRGQQGGQHTQGFAVGGPAPPPAATPATAPAPTASVPGVTAGLQDLNVGGSSAATSSAFAGAPAPPPASTTSATDAKAAEAAAESAAARQAESSNRYSVPPPSYAEPTGATEELPPAYVDDGQYRPPVDSKTGQQ
ncbi:hypothetical protein OQA88_9991 [Cercophora sp. LCS_1]